MALFCAAIKRDSVSLLWFPFLSYVQVFWCEFSLVCHLKCLYSHFSSDFCFLVIFVLLMLVLPVLFLAAIINLPMRFSMESLSHCIDASTLSSMLASPLPPSVLGTCSLPPSSLGCKALCIAMDFLVLWSICWSSSRIHFKIDPKYLTRGESPVFIPLMRFLP